MGATYIDQLVLLDEAPKGMDHFLLADAMGVTPNF